ncbi:MAG: SRPBCC family protein [Chloroflexota bacterium]
MAVVETSISINQPVEKVFAHITDIEKQKDGNPSITAIEMGGKVAVGTRYKIKMSLSGREFVIENEIVALEPNKTLGIKTLAAPPAAPVTNTYTLEKEGSGTKLSLAMDAVVMPGTEGMVVPSLRAGLDTALAGIKKALG